MKPNIRGIKRRANTLVWKVFRSLLLTGLCFLILYPVMVKLTASFKSPADMIDPNVVYLPREFTWANLVTVFRGVEYPRTFLYTVLFVSLVSFLQTMSCTLVAYGLARFRFFGRNLVFGLSIFTLIIPPQAILLPLYLKFRFFNPFEIFKLGGTLTGIPLTDTPIPFLLMALFAVGFKNGLYIFLLREHFRNMPAVLEEASYIDGSGMFRTFTQIMLPGAVPLLVTVFLFSFVWMWNDYYYTTILAPGLPTLNMKLLGMSVGDIGLILGEMGTSVLQSPRFILLITPLVVLYLLLQKSFTESIVKSGIVG